MMPNPSVNTSALTIGLSDYHVSGILDLILSCRNGWPYPLAELLVQYGRTTSEFRQWQIAARNPDWIAAQTLVAQIMADTPNLEDEATRKITDLRRLYKLDANDEAALTSAEQEIAQRKALQAA